MPTNKKPPSSDNKNISIGGDVKDSVVISGDNNTVNKTTIIQKFFNIFKSDSETLEHRNRRILLNHVENAWIKGVLDASLHGAALLDLGIKQDPEAVTQYPWAIKKESTDETLPAGTSMLEIFESIGMGRSLLILGAPGSGKTTMLLELARGLIARAREDVTQPIPMVFNLASWTEKLSLADWLAQELNNLYSVPHKTAPDWVKGDKLLLLLDGLDEVRQESRAKCVEAINASRKEHGLTSLAVCSRSQDYADLNSKLSFEGAIEVQPLTQDQITEFFNRFGDGMAGIKQALEKDIELREMAETPLFLSIMIMAYRGKQDVEILALENEKVQRKHLFDTYIERMFERRSGNATFKKHDVFRWLSWLAQKMIEHNEVSYLLENMQPYLVRHRNLLSLKIMLGLVLGMIYGLTFGLMAGTMVGIITEIKVGVITGLIVGPSYGLAMGLLEGMGKTTRIETIDSVTWDWKKARIGLITWSIFLLIIQLNSRVREIIFIGPSAWLFSGLIVGLQGGLTAKPIGKISFPGQRISLSLRNSFFVVALYGFIFFVGSRTNTKVDNIGMIAGIGLTYYLTILWLDFGGLAVIRHYALRLILTRNNLLPWRLVPFLDHCVDLIFLRRVGGGYIFVHRLLMEHFAEMYVETPTSKGN